MVVMMDRRRNITIIGGSILALSLTLTGCTSTEPAASAPATSAPAVPMPTETASPEASAAETLVRDYLDAIVAEDSEAAWALLTPEAQSFYGDDPGVYSSWFGRDGITTPVVAAAFADVEFTETEGPEGAFTLVGARTGTAADAWIVRDTESGPLLDDAGVPPTGSSVYEWRNPATGAEGVSEEPVAFDPSEPASIFFASPASMDSDGPSTIGYPDTVWAYADDTELPTELGPASDAGRMFLATPDAEADGPRALTFVWQIGTDSTGWRSSTALILP